VKNTFFPSFCVSEPSNTLKHEGCSHRPTWGSGSAATHFMLDFVETWQSAETWDFLDCHQTYGQFVSRRTRFCSPFRAPPTANDRKREVLKPCCNEMYSDWKLTLLSCVSVVVQTSWLSRFVIILRTYWSTTEPKEDTSSASFSRKTRFWGTFPCQRSPHRSKSLVSTPSGP